MATFTYRTHIKVSTDDLLAARAGRKTCTIRVGTIGVAKPVLDLTDGRSRIGIRVIEVDHSKRFRDLGEREIRGEGFTTRIQLDDDLRRYYGRIEPDTPLTIIWFEAMG